MAGIFEKVILCAGLSARTGCFQLPLVLVKGTPGAANQPNTFGVAQVAVKILTVLLDQLFGINRLFCCEPCTSFQADLFSI